jgi:DNA-binding GntR family transcriptional regulator
MRDVSTDVVNMKLLRRIVSEYLEMPGLALSIEQVERLWGLEHAAAVSAMHALVLEGFLRVTPRGVFVRAGSEK